MQGAGIADPFVDDLSTGQGIVLGRAATKLRSIEIQPLTGGSTSRRLVVSSALNSSLDVTKYHYSWLIAEKVACFKTDED